MKVLDRYFSKYAWTTLAINVMVILWGAVVRATGSGAGCGAHWPSCNGMIVPDTQQVNTLIEFIHRITSGLSLVMVVVLVAWCWRRNKPGSFLRWSSGFALAFIFSEAIVGAGLVLFHLTGTNDSVTRAVVIVIHLVNTFILLAALALTAWWSTMGEPEQLVWQGTASWLLVGTLLGMFFLGGSGAITALGDTLFPAASLTEGFNQDISATAHFLIRLRVYHPFVAVMMALIGGAIFRWLLEREKEPLAKKMISGVISLYIIQLLLGGINILLLAPVWMQVIHLLFSNLIWISAVLVLSLQLGRRRFLA
jgi:heme a synthase